MLPGMLYAEQIKQYRQEFLSCDSSLDGCGALRRLSNPEEWLAETEKYTKPETVPEGKVQAMQFLYIREEDNRLLGMIQVRHTLNEYLKNYAGISVIQYALPSEKKAMLPKC